MMRTRSNSIVRLDWYHSLVTRTILDFQDPVTGLLPPRILWNKQKPDPNEYLGDGWVRDNVYSILAVWGLALGYRKNADMDEDRAKAFELTQSVVKLMRGLLTCMMRQADKVEKFKKSHAKEDAVHAKYNLKTGGTCVGDNEWGHLQIDATSLYLLMLAEMTASGIQIIFTVDEVAFIQNLVFYIEKAYSIPDYGIWERGDKLNHGFPELNASSIGMAKAALEALDGLDLFGPEGGQSSVIHVLPDDIQQCKAILQSMLPRESHSKEIAASVLSVISFPAFAVQDEDIVNQARREIISKLQGRYGLKRFLRDGYKSPMEDPFRLHYEPAELEIFENTECEWPVFFVYLMLDGLFRDDQAQVKTYQNLLLPLLMRDETGLVFMPEMFYLPKDKVAIEKANPHSVERERGEYCPHLWSQSLYILSCLLNEKFIAVGEIDPLNRRHSIGARPDIVVQVCLMAENKDVSHLLQELDVPVGQVSCQGDPVQVLPANRLSSLYQQLGTNIKLGMTGRPYYDIGVLGTSMLYRLANTIFAFTPQFMDYQKFYLCLDNEFLADRVKSLVGFLGANWRILGRPTLTFTVTSAMLEDSLSSCIAKLIIKLKEGYLSGVRVRLGYLSDFLSTSCITTLHFVRDYDEEEVQHYSWSPLHHDEILKATPEGSPENCSAILFIPESVCSTPQNARYRAGSAPRRRSLAGTVKKSRNISIYSRANSMVSPGALPKVSLKEEEIPSNGWSPMRARRMSVDAETQETINQLAEAITIFDQADILHFLYNTRGPDFDVELYGRVGSTVEKLLGELYEKACQIKQWSLVRHTAGLLRKRVEDLAEAVTDILVHEKQLTVGTPLEGQEEIVIRPLPAEELKDIIFEVFGEDKSTGVVTQELLVYLGIFVRTEPRLFSEMLRLRVGLIIKVMVAELARAVDCSGEDAIDCFMNLSPFEMKSLLYHILSGKEFGMRNSPTRETQPTLVSSDVPKRVSIKKLSNTIRSLTGGSRERNSSALQVAVSVKLDDVKGERELRDEERLGQWIRRRCLDGALNRVPEDFYPMMWKVLDRCNGITIYNHHLPHAMIREMTAGEFKFALCMETALNRIPEPEYRQLVVEMLMVLSLVVECHPEQTLGDVIDVDQLVREGHQMYLHHQETIKGDSCVCCARPVHEKIGCGGAAGICRYFYDTAPSGRYGTMTYFSAAVASRLSVLPHRNECALC